MTNKFVVGNLKTGPSGRYICSDFSLDSFKIDNENSEEKIHSRIILIQSDLGTSFFFSSRINKLFGDLKSKTKAQFKKIAISDIQFFDRKIEINRFKKSLRSYIENEDNLNQNVNPSEKVEWLNCEIEDLVHFIWFLDEKGKLDLMRQDRNDFDFSNSWANQQLFNQITKLNKAFNPYDKHRKIWDPKKPGQLINFRQAGNWLYVDTQTARRFVKNYGIPTYRNRLVKYNDLRLIRQNIFWLNRKLREKQSMVNTNEHNLNIRIDAEHYHTFLAIKAKRQLTQSELLTRLIDEETERQNGDGMETSNRVLNELVRSVNRLNSVTDRQNKMIDLILEKLDTFFEN